MAATKATTVLLNSVASSSNSSAANTSADYIDTVFIQVVQNGNANTAATVQVLEQPVNGINFYGSPTKLFTAGVNAGTYQTLIAVDPTSAAVKVQYTQAVNGTNSVCTAELGQFTGV